MQLEITPGLITSLSALVVALDHNLVGGAYLVALAILVMLGLTYKRK